MYCKGNIVIMACVIILLMIGKQVSTTSCFRNDKRRNSMIIEDMADLLPKDWYPMDLRSKYEVFEIPRGTDKFNNLELLMFGSFNLGVASIYRVQNPLMYVKFQHKIFQYAQKGPYEIRRMYHDSSQCNAESIAIYNFDWRYGERFKYGPGVYFSSTPSLANACSNKLNGEMRAMFFADVLIGSVQVADHDVFLPDLGFDTVTSLHNATYVKYFDNEFYPAYVAFYYSAVQQL